MHIDIFPALQMMTKLQCSQLARVKGPSHGPRLSCTGSSTLPVYCVLQRARQGQPRAVRELSWTKRLDMMRDVAAGMHCELRFGTRLPVLLATPTHAIQLGQLLC